MVGFPLKIVMYNLGGDSTKSCSWVTSTSRTSCPCKRSVVEHSKRVNSVSDENALEAVDLQRHDIENVQIYCN